MLLQITNDQEYNDAIERLKAVEKIQVHNMSKGMFKFLQAQARAVHTYLVDVCCCDCPIFSVNRFLFKLAYSAQLDPRSYRLQELAHKKEDCRKRADFSAKYLTNPINIVNF